MGLRDRLLRLDRRPGSSPPPSAVDDLRRRLDRVLGSGRVVSAAELAPRALPPRDERPRLSGRPLRTKSGTSFVCETLYGAGSSHGSLPVSALGALPGSAAARLFREHLGDVALPEAVAFLDTETTGLAGGAGTVAFLVGVARWTPDGFRIAQLFLEDLDREPALLDALASELDGVECLVTYNGRTFDVPLLENRHVLNRALWPLGEVPHLDLLPPARTLWRHDHPDCRLVTLERGVLGFVRHGDVPGSEIPGIYARYLRHGPDRDLLGIFDHNRWDLLALAGLLWAAGETSGAPAGAPGLGIGALHARRGRATDALQALECSLAGDLPDALRPKALRQLSLACKRVCDWERAVELWSELRRLAPAGDPFPVVEAAKALEHHLDDPAGALSLVDEALQAGLWAASDREDLERRAVRLRRKLGTQADNPTEAES